MSTYETLLIEGEGAIRTIVINRPQVLNAISQKVVAELDHVLGELAADDTLRGVILTGAGDKAFVAGADIKAMANMNPEQALEFAAQGHAIGDKIAQLGVPVIAAVNGHALGGGCELALACDFIYASESASFGQPEVKLGVIPGFGGTQRLLRRVGLARALELCMTGERIKADEAYRIGLVNKVLPQAELLPAARKTLETIAQQGPLAVAVVKGVLHAGAEEPLHEANHREQQGFASLFSSADQKEGMRAFLEKRAAKFERR